MHIKDYVAPIGEIAPMTAIHEDDEKARKPFDNYLSRTNRLSKSSLNSTMFKKYRDFLKQNLTRRQAAELKTARLGESSAEQEVLMVYKNESSVFVIAGNDWYRYRFGAIAKLGPIFTKHGIAFKDDQGMYVDENGQLIKIDIETQETAVVELECSRGCRKYVINSEFVAILDEYAVRITSLIDDEKEWYF